MNNHICISNIKANTGDKLAKKIVSVLLEKLDRKKGKTQYKKLEVIQPRIKYKSELPAGE